MTKPDIEAIRQSPRQYVDLETVESLSDYAMLLEQQLAEARKQNVLLRNALTKLYRVVTQAKPDVTVMCDVHAALDATQDLSGGVICDAEPVRHIYKFVWQDGSSVWSDKPTCNGATATETVPLYKAMKP